MKKIILVSHTDTLTGAPRLLMDMADILYAAGHHITFVVKNASDSGLLGLRKNKFKVWEMKRYRAGFLGRISAFLQHKWAIQQFKRLLQQSDIVINNTIDNHDLLPYYQRYAKGKTITYLHELDAVIETHLPSKTLKQNLTDATTHFIVPAQYIKERVALKLNVPLHQVSVINSKVSDTLDNTHPLPISKQKDEFWVGMCGTPDFRKGVDVFVQLAAILKHQYPHYNIKLVWLGWGGEASALVEEDIRKLGLENSVYLIPKTLYPDAFYLNIDVFTLTSREDPYPLVVLSAATAGKPILCFDKAGGSVDFVEDNCGFIVPFLDVTVFCEKIVYLFEHQDIRLKLGANAKRRVSEWHHQDNLILKQLEMVFDGLTKVQSHNNIQLASRFKLDTSSTL